MNIKYIIGGFAMPTYEYRCEECKKEFSLDMSIREHDQGKIKCPKCKSEKTVQLLSQFTAQTSRKS
jgi:putative FmdB family regulatory protein